MRIRDATGDDFEVLRDLDGAVFGAHAYDSIAMRQFVDLFGGLVLLAEDGAAAVGYGLAGIDLAGACGWVLAVGVLPAARGRGVGAALTAELVARLKLRGVARVRLTVEPDNLGAIALYARLGFVTVERVADYFGPGEDRLVLERVV